LYAQKMSVFTNEMAMRNCFALFRPRYASGGSYSLLYPFVSHPIYRRWCLAYIQFQTVLANSLQNEKKPFFQIWKKAFTLSVN